MNIKTLITVFVCMIVFATGCKKDEETHLSVNFDVGPTSGTGINTLSCSFTGEISGTIKPVTVTVEWWWEDGNHENRQMKSSQEFIFENDLPTYKSTTYSAAPGNILLNYFWVEIKWTDDAGSREEISNVAFCEP